MDVPNGFFQNSGKERRSMKGKLRIIESLVALVCAVLLLASTIFAWITLRPTAEVQEFVVNAGEYKLGIKLELRKRNEFLNGEFTECRTREDIQEFFRNAVPNDSFDFRLTLTNRSSFPVKAKITLLNIQSSALPEGFDMRDVFYIDDGTVKLDGEEWQLAVNSEDEAELHGQTLNLHRLSNLMDGSSNILLLENVPLALEQAVVIEFTLTYDRTTSHMNYQNGVIGIDAILINYE